MAEALLDEDEIARPALSFLCSTGLLATTDPPDGRVFANCEEEIELSAENIERMAEAHERDAAALRIVAKAVRVKREARKTRDT